MRLRKILFTISLLMFVLTGTVACGNEVNREEEALISNFLSREYAQLYYSEAEQARMNQEREVIATTISLDDGSNQEAARAVGARSYYHFYQENLTPDFYETMVANKKIPNQKTLEESFDYSEVTDITLNKKGGMIETTFKVNGYCQTDISETKRFQADFKLKKVGDTLYIDDIDGDLGW